MNNRTVDNETLKKYHPTKYRDDEVALMRERLSWAIMNLWAYVQRDTRPQSAPFIEWVDDTFALIREFERQGR